MKTPRITDFDPNAEPEAEAPRLGSPMDDLPTIRKPEAKHSATPDKHEENPNHAATPQKRNATSPHRRNTAMLDEEAQDVLGEGFDINAPHDTKGSFLLTQAEYDALSDLKRPLGRQYGVQITLHDLARCSVNLLLDDLERHGEQSFLHRHLKHKTQK